MSKLLPVTKVASDYSEEELVQFQKQFSPVLQKIRDLGRRVGVVVFLAVCIAVCSIICIFVLWICVAEFFDNSPNIPKWLLGLFVIAALLLTFCMISGIIYFRIPMKRYAKCPACHNSLLSRPRHLTYCPECGSNQLEGGYWLMTPRCNSCGKWLTRGKGGRHYKIRFCPHCGIFLDEKGF